MLCIQTNLSDFTQSDDGARSCCDAQDTRDPAAVSRGNDQKRAVLAASVLGTAMVLVYSLISFLLLLRYSFQSVELENSSC